ncbi:hypothetical protein CFN78_05185 [Amycolatopsis antarctica]|uniref:Regulator of SigK n=1 Tax=Amycolatopsis antarctica TaxID=1854586 RepID=A0A263D7R1_9PSEU|nr:anti-sigma factor [Amycolatopsis antarctica]OZM74510.1 hypothetical protein CFN78_05185 [Amycolatopsis antarctica]
MTSPDMHTLAGAYALDALSEHERARFQRHLDECAACTQEVREMRATAARLGAAVAADPSPEFKQRVLAQVRTTRQDSPTASVDSVERTRRRTGAPRWAVGLSAAAAVVGLAVAGVSAGLASDANDELTVAQQQLEQARAQYSPAGDLLTASDVRIASNDALTGGGGTVVASQSQNRMMFLGSQLPDHGPDHDYQIWLMDPEGIPRSAGIVGTETAGDGVLMTDGIQGMAKVAMTVEPKGGSPEPTTAPVLWVDLPA